MDWRETEHLTTVCDVCTTDGQYLTASSFCGDCMEFLCTECTKHHSKNEILRTHTIFGKDFEFSTLRHMKDILCCKDHGNQRDYICEDHKTLICDVCIKRSHRNCCRVIKSASSPQIAVDKISEYIDKQNGLSQSRIDLRKRKKSAKAKQARLFANIKDFIEKTKETESSASPQEMIMENVADENQFVSYNDLLQVVLKLDDPKKACIIADYILLSNCESDVTCDLLLTEEQATAREEELADKFSDLLSFMQMDPAASSQHQNDGKSFMLFGKQSPTGTSPDKITTETVDAETQTEVHEEISHSSDFLTDVADSLGAMPNQPVLCDRSTMTELVRNRDASCQITDNNSEQKNNMPLLQRDIDKIPSSYKFRDINDQSDEVCRISDIVILDDNIIFTDIIQNKLKLFDGSLHLKSFLAMNEVPYSICRVLKNSVAVSCLQRRVDIYNVGRSISFCRGFKMKYYCRSVCEVSEGKMAILVSNIPLSDESKNINMVSSDKDLIHIEIRDPYNGQILSVIDDFGDNLVMPLFIVQDSKKRIVIGQHDVVSAVNEAGNTEWFYKSHHDANLVDVRGLTLDNEGNVYICGRRSDNIHQVSCLNYKHSRVIIPHIKAPRSIAYDQFHNRLIVGCDDSEYLYEYNFV